MIQTHCKLAGCFSLVALAATAAGQPTLLKVWSHTFDRLVSNVDVNGDGFPDVGMTLYDTVTQTRKLRVYSGAGPSYQMLWSQDWTNVTSNYEDSIALADISGDGYVDLVHGQKWTGRDRGSATLTLSSQLGLFAFPTWRNDGGADFDLYGDQVVVLSEAGRQTRDVAVGASGYCSNVSYVRIMSPRGEVLREARDRTCSYFGSAMTNAGDVDRDGYDDLLVGANEHSVPGPGRAVLFSGRTLAVLYTWQGREVRDHLGCCVAGLGDVNGDGYPDVAVGANQHENGAQGYVRVLSGSNGNVLWTASGRAAGDYYGGDVAGTGDVDGDGTPDLAISAYGGGYVELRDGRDGTLLCVLNGPQGFGSRVVAGGRVGGRTRLLVGTPAGVSLYEFEPSIYRTIGAGCRGSVDVPVLAAESGRAPRGGYDYRMVAQYLPQPEAAILAVGASTTAWGSPPVPLPLDLGRFGMPGCRLFTSIEVTLPLLRSGPGTASTSFPVPAIHGFGFFMQALVLDTAANSLGMIVSNAIEART